VVEFGGRGVQASEELAAVGDVYPAGHSWQSW
jgi:hypothetical protein